MRDEGSSRRGMGGGVWARQTGGHRTCKKRNRKGSGAFTAAAVSAGGGPLNCNAPFLAGGKLPRGTKRGYRKGDNGPRKEANHERECAFLAGRQEPRETKHETRYCTGYSTTLYITHCHIPPPAHSRRLSGSRTSSNGLSGSASRTSACRPSRSARIAQDLPHRGRRRLPRS